MPLLFSGLDKGVILGHLAGFEGIRPCHGEVFGRENLQGVINGREAVGAGVDVGIGIGLGTFELATTDSSRFQTHDEQVAVISGGKLIREFVIQKRAIATV